MGKGGSRTNYIRRGIGLVAGCSPLLLLVASLVHGLSGHNQLGSLGLFTEVIALLVGGINFYLSIVRGQLYRRRTGSLDGYRHVSGLPVVGSVLVVLGVFLGFGSVVASLVGLAAVAGDTGGSVWFLIASWRDASFWDAPPSRRR